MAEQEDPKEKPVRFDFPTGASTDVIANALTEARKRIMAKQYPKKD